MHTLESLVTDLKTLGIEPNDTLMVHSSMKAIGEVEGGADTVLDALQSVLSEGLLILPTHTWKEWNNPGGLFDPEREPSCVGVLTEIFRKRPGVFRSLHPSHSVAAWGVGAEEYVQGEEYAKSPGPRDGCWGRLYDHRAKILFLGAKSNTNTYLHSVEEWYDIDERVAETPTRFRVKKGDEILELDICKHHSKFWDPSQNFDKIEPLAVERGIAKVGIVGDATSVLMEAVGLADMVAILLEKNAHLFDQDTPLDELYRGIDLHQLFDARGLRKTGE
jgi:aminoglycoside 3-N-acetyltransferase